MLKNIVWSDPSREHDLPQGWRAHTAPSERGSKVLQFDMQVMPRVRVQPSQRCALTALPRQVSAVFCEREGIQMIVRGHEVVAQGCVALRGFGVYIIGV